MPQKFMRKYGIVSTYSVTFCVSKFWHVSSDWPVEHCTTVLHMHHCFHFCMYAILAPFLKTFHQHSPSNPTGFGSNILLYCSFGLRSKTSLCFENNFALGLSHNQSGYNLNHSSSSPCNLLLRHAIPRSQSASTFQLYAPHQTLLQV